MKMTTDDWLVITIGLPFLVVMVVLWAICRSVWWAFRLDMRDFPFPI